MKSLKEVVYGNIAIFLKNSYSVLTSVVIGFWINRDKARKSLALRVVKLLNFFNTTHKDSNTFL